MNSQSGEQSAIAGALGTVGHYEGVGHSLKVVRERRNLALADVSARLRIRRPYLEAIEEGRFAELPGAVYVSGFLRQYAEFLGLDPEQVLKSYQGEADGSVQRTVLNFPLPRPEERTPRLWLVVGALVIAAVAYGLWYRHQEALRIGHELIEAVPSRLADLVPSPQPIAPSAPLVLPPLQPASPPPVVAAAPLPSAPILAPPTPAAPVAPVQTPAVAQPVVPPPAASSPPVVTAAPPAAAPIPAPAAQAPVQAPAAVATAPQPATPGNYGATDAASRIRLEAVAPSWIQVRGPNNEQVFTRLLNAGERYQVPDRAGLTLLTGNAGGVRVVVDGQTLAPLGNEGEVKRGISLDPERLKNPGGERQG